MKNPVLSNRLLAALDLPLLQLFGSTYCNLDCPYCSQGEDRSAARHGDLFARDEFLARLEHFPKTHFYCSGGEPLIHKGIHAFLAKAGKHGHIVSMDTNGTISTSALARILDAMPREQWGFFNISHHLLAGVSCEQIHEFCAVLRDADVPHFVKYVGTPENIAEIDENMRALRDTGSGVAVSILQTFATPWNGRNFPLEYTDKELRALLDMVTLTTHGMQFFGGIKSLGHPCLAGSSYAAYNMKNHLELTACCHRGDHLRWDDTVWGVEHGLSFTPCKADACVGDLMFVLGVQGLGQEKERFAKICAGDSPAVGLEKVCAAIQCLSGRSQLLYRERFDNFRKNVLGNGWFAASGACEEANDGLSYPYERLVASGARTGEEFAKMTDGERTPWAEWYDKAKIERLFGNDFMVPLEMNFGADQIEFNVFQLNRADNSSLPETERAAFPQHSIPSLQHIRQMMTEPGNAGESISSNVVLLRNAEGEFGGYEYATYAEVRNSGKPVIGDDLVFSYATIRDHATIPFFPIPSGIRGINDQEKRHFLLELHFPSIADVSCQWTIQIQDDSYATLAALSPPHLTVEHAGCRRMRVPFVIEDAGVSEIRIVFCPEVRAGEGVLPSRICVREMTFFEKAPSSAPEMEIPPFPQRLHGALRHVGQDALGTFLGERLPGTRWEDSANLPLPPVYDDMCDVRILRYLFRNFRPNRHLEFGTWKGNGVRRVLEECGNASVWTVNLWEGEDRPDGTWAYGENYKDEDIAVVGAEFEGEYIRTDAGVMIGIEYLKAGLGSRVSQIYSDSRLWNDSAYPDGFFDSVFVDGGHDADTARSDVQKALRLLRPGGLLLLHDFCPRPEEYSRFPNTVGITNMVAEEIGNIAMMCSDFFWIEDTWLFCGIRGNLTKNL